MRTEKQGDILSYISFCFHICGINYIAEDTLKKGKQNKPAASTPLTKLIFDLSLLEITDFNYTIVELGVNVDDQQQFMQEFVLAYLSQASCPFLQVQSGQYHTLDFGSSRILLLIVGWMMAKIDFFSMIRKKVLHKKLLSLDSSTKESKSKENYEKKQNSKGHPYESIQQNEENVQKLYKKLISSEFRNECLQQKKQRVLNRLSKQLQQYNKKNQQNIKIQSILKQASSIDPHLADKQAELLSVVSQFLARTQSQQYFWMWLQAKVIEPEFKSLQTQFEQDYVKIEEVPSVRLEKLNPDYLQRYIQEYKQISYKMESINTFMSDQEESFSQKPPKDSLAIEKQVTHDIKSIMEERNPQLLQELGTPCFLKMEVIKFCEKNGFGEKQKKKKKKKPNENQNENEMKEELKHKIQQFMRQLDQLKFI